MCIGTHTNIKSYILVFYDLPINTGKWILLSMKYKINQ